MAGAAASRSFGIVVSTVHLGRTCLRSLVLHFIRLHLRICYMYVYRLPVILSLSVCLYVYVCVNVCVCSFDPMYACLYDVCMNGCMMSVCLSVCLSVCPSFCRSVIGMYACLSIELSSQLAALKFFAPS